VLGYWFFHECKEIDEDIKVIPVRRHSPVVFPAEPKKTEERDGWTVVLEYEEEGTGPHLIDLSHRSRWDVQDTDLSNITPWDIHIPEKPGTSVYDKGILINRMNRTQASIWHLSGILQNPPEDNAFTEMTDAVTCLAIAGKGLFLIAEKLCSLDLLDPKMVPPYLILGPFAHVPCQLAVMNRNDDEGALIFTCSRGYASDMVHTILEAGNAFGIRPAGERTLAQWI
jgi:hypothetical protein